MSIFAGSSFDQHIEKIPKSGIIIKKNLEEMFRERRSTLLVIPAVSRQVLTMAQSLSNCILAGGAALELYTGDINKIKDWDLFFSETDGHKQARSILKKLGFKDTNQSDYSGTLEKSGVIVQLISKRTYKNIKKLFDNFDFSVCCFAVQGPNIYYTEQAAADVEAKQLNYIYTDNIISAIKRIARYGKKGYTPTTQCVKDLLNNGCDMPEDDALDY